MPPAAAEEIIGSVRGLGSDERDPDEIREILLSTVTRPDRGAVARIVDVVARDKPLRYWNQDGGDWLTNVRCRWGNDNRLAARDVRGAAATGPYSLTGRTAAGRLGRH